MCSIHKYPHNDCRRVIYSMQMAESQAWITKCGSTSMYDLLPGMDILYVIPFTPLCPILGKSPTGRAGVTWTIPYLCSGTNHFDRNAYSAPGSVNGSPMYFVNSWAMGWTLDFQILSIMFEYYPTLHNAHR